MESSPWVRLAMAGGLYLLVIWGHHSLMGGTSFAIFYAFVMAAMLVYWSSLRAVDQTESEYLFASNGDWQDFDEYAADDWQSLFDAQQIIQSVEPEHTWDTIYPDSYDPDSNDAASHPTDRESIKCALDRIDAIKAELKTQYAQFGKDQTAWRSGDRWRFNGL